MIWSMTFDGQIKQEDIEVVSKREGTSFYAVVKAAKKGKTLTTNSFIYSDSIEFLENLRGEWEKPRKIYRVSVKGSRRDEFESVLDASTKCNNRCDSILMSVNTGIAIGKFRFTDKRPRLYNNIDKISKSIKDMAQRDCFDILTALYDICDDDTLEIARALAISKAPDDLRDKYISSWRRNRKDSYELNKLDIRLGLYTEKELTEKFYKVPVVDDFGRRTGEKSKFWV